MSVSQTGFMKNHMRKYFADIERPYTPPVTNFDDMKESTKVSSPSK